MVKGSILWIGIMVFGVLAGDIVGDIPVWVNLRSALLVFVGTMIGGFLSAPFGSLASFITNLSASLRRKTFDPHELIRQIIGMAKIQRSLDIRELSKRYEAVENTFLRRGLLQVLDHHDRNQIEERMEKECFLYLSNLQSHLAVIQYFIKLAPVFGFVGTIVGLISVLNHMGDPTQIGYGMAISLLTTFYGLLLGNLLFAPLSGKMAVHIQAETLMLNIIIDGVLAISDGQVPMEITNKLSSYIDKDAEETNRDMDMAAKPSLWQRWIRAPKHNGLAR